MTTNLQQKIWIFKGNLIQIAALKKRDIGKKSNFKLGISLKNKELIQNKKTTFSLHKCCYKSTHFVRSTREISL